MSQDYLLSLNGVYKKFNKEEVLKGISFTIKKGEIVGYIGNNGAGKTTTVNLILQFLKPDRGEINYGFNDRDLFSNLSHLPEENLFPDFLSGKDFLNYFYYFKTRTPLPDHLIDFFDSFFEIKGYLPKKIKSYSKGMKRKIGIVNAILPFSNLIILDEPFEGLDPSSQIALLKLIKEVNEKYGSSFFISSHILSNLEELCHRIIFLKKGKIELNEKMEDLEKRGLKLKNLFEGLNNG